MFFFFLYYETRIVTLTQTDSYTYPDTFDFMPSKIWIWMFSFSFFKVIRNSNHALNRKYVFTSLYIRNVFLNKCIVSNPEESLIKHPHLSVSCISSRSLWELMSWMIESTSLPGFWIRKQHTLSWVCSSHVTTMSRDDTYLQLQLLVSLGHADQEFVWVDSGRLQLVILNHGLSRLYVRHFKKSLTESMHET